MSKSERRKTIKHRSLSYYRASAAPSAPPAPPCPCAAAQPPAPAAYNPCAGCAGSVNFGYTPDAEGGCGGNWYPCGGGGA